jgi:hypothetical protein
MHRSTSEPDHHQPPRNAAMYAKALTVRYDPIISSKAVSFFVRILASTIASWRAFLAPLYVSCKCDSLASSLHRLRRLLVYWRLAVRLTSRSRAISDDHHRGCRRENLDLTYKGPSIMYLVLLRCLPTVTPSIRNIDPDFKTVLQP